MNFIDNVEGFVLMKVALIEGWFTKLWTLASTRLAMLAAFVVWLSTQYPQQYADFMESLEWWQKIGIAFVVWSASAGSRVVAFKKS